MRKVRFSVLFVALAAAPTATSAQDASAPVVFDDLGLTITPPKLDGIAYDGTAHGQVRASWRGKLEASTVDVRLFVLASREFGFVEPENVTDVLLDSLRNPGRFGSSFGWDEIGLVSGAYGWTPYASLAFGVRRKGADVTGRIFELASLLPEAGYTLEISVLPDVGESARKALLDALRRAVVYKGPAREWKWTDEEARARWVRDAPEATHKKLDPPLRTAHYLILTNSSGGKKFAEKMEEAFAAIRKTYPFDDVKGRRLMPVFLFRSPEEYYDYCHKVIDWPPEVAKASKGHAFKDYYATWYEAPNDPVHVHEATHQIFANRLRLGGGGSWFQEGLAEYMSTAPNDRNVAAKAVAKGRAVPLLEFVKIPNLLASKKKEGAVDGESAAHDNYIQASLLIEFLRESKWGKAKFEAWFHAVGLAPRSDVPAIEAATQRTYGCGLAELEKQWIEYCKKR